MTDRTAQVRAHLTEDLIPFWKSLRDDTRGGYVSLVGSDLTRDPLAERGCILNSRILWFFASAYGALGEESLLGEAAHAYEALLGMLDPVNGGMYWSVDAAGHPLDTTKHTYNQAFAVYALSTYARVTGERAPLDLAFRIFETIETRCRDAGGYLEAQSADWRPAGNDKLSENGVEAGRTMNTLLHVLEGYTALYEAGGDPRVRERLREILDTWAEKVWNPEKRRQEVFFDPDWHTLIDLHSFGHDIETSWLADHTLEVLGDEALTARIRPKLLAMAEETLKLAWTAGNGFSAEMERGKVDTTRVWWVQAEALLGFLHAWGLTREARFLDAARDQWDYIREKVIDPRCGEWRWSLREDGTDTGKPFVEPWKCPYHNGRMCLEVLRLGAL